MKRLRALCACFILHLSLSAPVVAMVIDAPHNATNSITCGTCHSYSLWWRYSPTTLSATPEHTTIVDTVCMTCHDGNHDKPWALTHSSSSIGSLAHGLWGVGCTDCHNPHSQDQLNWIGSGNTPYLVTGTITAVSYAGPPTNQTTITYSGATANPHWPAEGVQNTDPSWRNKSVNNPGRGLILVQDTAKRANSYSIVSASPTQVVVRGQLDSTAIDPNYVDPQTQVQNSATSNTFGLIYGQLIKTTIAGKPVKFFDPYGGYVAAGTGTTGICQVCHTLTSRFTDNGVLPSGSDPHVGRVSENCATCHKHDTGFKGQEPHSLTSFAWAGNCAACHNPDNAAVDIVKEIHGDLCGTCHVASSGGGPRKEGDPADGIDGTAIGAGPAANCLDCHITLPSLASGGIHHTSAHGYAAAGDCTQCHQDTVGKLAADHSATIAASVNCTTCHSQTAGTAAGAPIDPNNATIHDDCTTCHETTGALKPAYGVASAMPAGGGACEACHGEYFNRHTHAHTVALGPNDYFLDSPPPGQLCSTCHSVQTWLDIVTTHLGDCGTCHNATRDINPYAPTGTTVPMVIANATHRTVNCLDCHQQHRQQHAFVSDPSCSNCHFLDYGMDVVTDIHANNCGLCHVDPGNGNYARRAGADGSAIGAVSTSSCTDCHNPATYPTGAIHHDTYYALNGNCIICHSNPDHSAIHDNGYCEGCHPGSPAAAVSLHGPCLTCHNTDGTWKLGPTPFPNIYVQVYPGPGACDTCHGNYFVNHSNADHTTHVATSPNCDGCHAAATIAGTTAGVPVDPASNKVHDACASCHDTMTGALRAPYGKAIAMPATGGTCEACHGDYFPSHVAADHSTAVTSSPTCNLSTCHPAADVIGTASGIPVNPADNKVHDACTTCHETTGVLKQAYGKAIAMPAGGGPCEACHGGYSDAHPNYVHTMPTVSLCLGCHVANSAPFVANGEVHSLQGCATCHYPLNGTLIGSAFGKGNGANCEDCHGASHPPYDHTGAVRANSATTPTTANCTWCHQATIPPFVATGETHALAGCMGCHNPTDGTLIGSAAGHTGGGECVTCHSTYFDGHSHGNSHNVLMRETDMTNTGYASYYYCNICHRRGGVNAVNNPLFDNAWDGPEGILALHQNSCDLCHNSTRTTNLSTPYRSINDVITNGINVGCLTCHADGASNHPPDPHNFEWEAYCDICHGMGSASTAAPKGEILPGVHSNKCGLCHLGGIGGNTLIGSAANATIGVIPHLCTECHVGGFDSHIHGTGSNHDVLMRATDLQDGTACNACHRRGGTSSSNPLFTNTWSGTDGIFALHQNSCALCHASTRATGIEFPYTSVNDVIMTGVNVGCQTCHASPHPTPHQYYWDGNCYSCHTDSFNNGYAHHDNCSLCHINPSGGGQRRAGTDGDATLGTNYQPRGCLTCHPATTYPANTIHHDTPTAANNDCVTCHASVDHSTSVPNTALCADCHGMTGGTSSRMPVDMANDRVHDSCRTCHTFNPVTLAGELVAPTGNRGVTAMVAGSCTNCHTAPSSTLHHTNNAHALTGECEYCHTDPRNSAGGLSFQETPPAGGIPAHLPCEECHVTPKRGVSPGVNGWTATPGQMTIYAFNEGSSHSTTDYSSDFTRSIAHSGGHVIANTAGQINNWGICFSCHDGSGLPGHAVRVTPFHAKPTALVATNLSCGNSGTSRFAPGREARNSIGNFDFFASTFRPASTRPGGASGSCKQAGDWSGAVKYGSTIYTASDLAVPDPWSTATTTLPMFPVQAQLTATTPAADNVKVTSAGWDGASIVVNATNTDGCAALTAHYNGYSQPFTGTTTCTAAFSADVIYSSAVPTLDVITTNPDGLGVIGYRISAP